MSMFASGVKSLQKRTSQVLKVASDVAATVQDVAGGGLEGLQTGSKDDQPADTGPLPRVGGASARALWQLGGYDSAADNAGPMIVRYEIRAGGNTERQQAAFVMPAIASGTSLTAAVIRKVFPVPGRFHFRFKAPTPDGAFGGWIWIDLANDDQHVPVYQGEVCMKVLLVPDGAPHVSHKALPGGGQRETAPMPPTPADCQGLGSLDFGGARSPARSASPPACSSDAGHQTPTRSPSPPVAAFSPEPRRDTNSAHFTQNPLSRTPASPAASSDLISPGEDLMDVGFTSPPPPPPVRQTPTTPVVPAAPPPPSKVFDRAALVREREEECQRRVDEAAKAAADRTAEEEQLKRDKQRKNNELGTVMDAWAKTSDGQNWKDIKALLSTLHTVIWADSGWKDCPLSELITDDKNIKKYYRKAVLLAHPDKQKDAAPDQQVRADRIFQALNESFKILNSQS